MFGRVGATYTLKVEYDDYYATAETRILPSPVVEGMRVVRSEDSDSLYQIEITIKDENIETDYYQVFTKTGASSKQFFASYLGYFTDEVLADGTFIPVFRGKSVMDEEYTPYFKENDSVSVKISRIARRCIWILECVFKECGYAKQHVFDSSVQSAFEYKWRSWLLVWYGFPQKEYCYFGAFNERKQFQISFYEPNLQLFYICSIYFVNKCVTLTCQYA